MLRQISIVWIAVLLASVVAAPAFGQWQPNSEGIHYEGGNVAIGLTNPDRDFTVSTGSNVQTMFAVENTDQGHATIGLDANGGQVTGTDYLLLRQKNDLTSVIGNWANKPLLLKTDGTERMRIGRSGNVGVGTPSPSDQLHVDGGGIRMERANGTPYLRFDNSGAGSGSDRWVIQVNSPHNGDLRFRSETDDVNHMVINGSGAVGIGTTSPNEKLTVAGNVLAEEVIVKPQDEWADFVFDESYELPSLKEVSSFIEKEGHLPDVPSAESVKKNGLRLGEMDATLLKKVEELTLYAIEQKEQADRLESRLVDQKRRADRHEARADSLSRQIQAERETRIRQGKRQAQQIESLQRQVELLRGRLEAERTE